MMTKDQYIDSLRNLNLNLYMFGEKIDRPVTHPIIRPSLNSIAETYLLAEEPNYEELMTAASHLTGKKINRFTHIHQSADDLIKKVKMQRLLGQRTAACFQRCVGMDAANAIYSTAYEIDAAKKTHYFERFCEYWKRIQNLDLVVDGAMTDPKGDRSLPPSRQEDPDLFLRVVERNPDGIVVRGAKLHQTGMINSHEVLVMPTMSMKEADRDYAVCFSVNTDAKGIVIIYGRQSCDTRKLERDADIDLGNKNYGGHECMVVFDDVFVPSDRVFMDGEYEFSGMMVERFAGYHRQSYGGCKVGVGDVLIGAAALAADYSGVGGASHIKDKIIEMTHLNETLYACGISCSCEGKKTASGNYLIDLLLANVCKQNVTRFPYEITRLAEDIAGGMMVTLPAEQDLKNPQTGRYIEKYYCAAPICSARDRIRAARLIENMTLGAAAVGYRTESMHGAGSPQAQRVMIARQSDIEQKKRLAKRVAGIKES
jgi:4-hydroxybutyryl-CoA dehydratase/vinylacetyl-CoA-Delta-isomerase